MLSPRFLRPLAPLLFLSSPLPLLGCDHTAAVATYPKCPVPVLLSRVDRVGGLATGTDASAHPFTSRTYAREGAVTGQGDSALASDKTPNDLYGPALLAHEVLRQLPDDGDARTVTVSVSSVDAYALEAVGPFKKVTDETVLTVEGDTKASR
jgi:hypothetical protein